MFGNTPAFEPYVLLLKEEIDENLFDVIVSSVHAKCSYLISR